MAAEDIDPCTPTPRFKRTAPLAAVLATWFIRFVKGVGGWPKLSGGQQGPTAVPAPVIQDFSFWTSYYNPRISM